MNTRSLIATAMVCATALAVSVVMSNAGPLNPPAGPVAPTPGPEPRIPVNAANTPGDADSLFRISAPGSYYLTGNITGELGKHGVEIEADNVTLDLNGFALVGAPGSLNGVNMPATQASVVIRNGLIADWGGDGVNARIDNGAIENVHAHGNGGWGIDNGATFASHITGCSALSNGVGVAGTGGIRTGAGATVESCQARANTGVGIAAGIGSTVIGNTAGANAGDGVFAASASTVSGNSASNNTGDGIQVSSDSFVFNNACDSNGNGGDGAGIHVTGDDNRIESNNATSNDRGIDIGGAGNLIIRNSASGNMSNFVSVSGNTFGFIVDATTIGANSNPHANYSF